MDGLAPGFAATGVVALWAVRANSATKPTATTALTSAARHVSLERRRSPALRAAYAGCPGQTGYPEYGS
jgi:hypothetical protein